MAKRPTPTPIPPPAHSISIDVNPAPEAGQALTLRDQASALRVLDKPGHQNALEFLRGAKRLKRTIEDHWQRITRNVDELKKNLLDLKRRDLEPVEAAIQIADVAILAYDNAQRERERIEQDRIRRQAEQDAERRRARELAEQEERALRLEQDSADLSQREQVFVEALVDGRTGPAAAQRAGYKDPAGASARLLDSEKIQRAIGAKREAAELRTQQAATKAAPLDVVVPRATSQRASVAGTRTVTTYTCEVLDAEALVQAVIDGTVANRKAIMPNQVELNSQARDLKDAFESVYPGCRLVKRQTTAG